MNTHANYNLTDETDEAPPVAIRFCSDCNNILSPFSEDGVLVYKCMKPNCEFRLTINGSGRYENLVSRKEFLKEKNLIIDPDFAIDPTMPREFVTCPTCGYGEAVFLISTDLEDTKIQLIYICANRKCGHSWKKHVAE